jgi:hypothetical protein
LKPLQEGTSFGYIVTGNVNLETFRTVMNNCSSYNRPQHNVRFFSAIHGDNVNLYVGGVFETHEGATSEEIERLKENHFREYIEERITFCDNIQMSRHFSVQPSITYPVSGVSRIGGIKPLMYMLIGDASHGVNFFTGSGLNYGFSQVLHIAQMLNRLEFPMTFQQRYKCCVWYSAIVNSDINLKLVRGARVLGGEYSTELISENTDPSLKQSFDSLISKLRGDGLNIPQTWREVADMENNFGPAQDLSVLVQYWEQFHGSVIFDQIFQESDRSYRTLIGSRAETPYKDLLKLMFGTEFDVFS